VSKAAAWRNAMWENLWIRQRWKLLRIRFHSNSFPSYNPFNIWHPVPGCQVRGLTSLSIFARISLNIGLIDFKPNFIWKRIELYVPSLPRSPDRCFVHLYLGYLGQKAL
jgi:hypothetical protein